MESKDGIRVDDERKRSKRVTSLKRDGARADLGAARRAVCLCVCVCSSASACAPRRMPARVALYVAPSMTEERLLEIYSPSTPVDSWHHQNKKDWAFFNFVLIKKDTKQLSQNNQHHFI